MEYSLPLVTGATVLERTNWGLHAEGRFSSYTNRIDSDAGFHSIDQSSWWETNTNLQGYWQVLPTVTLENGC